MNADELRRKFIEDNGSDLLTEFSEVLHGKRKEFSCDQSWVVSRSMDMLQEMISKASDLHKVETQSAADVMKELAKGKISEAQADRILDMLQKKQAIEELPKLIEQMEKLNQ